MVAEKITMDKAELMMQRGWQPSGIVLTREIKGFVERAIIDMGAVRRLENEEFWDIMHPAGPKTIPADAERYTGGPEGSNWVKGWASKFWGLRYE